MRRSGAGLANRCATPPVGARAFAYVAAVLVAAIVAGCGQPLVAPEAPPSATPAPAAPVAPPPSPPPASAPSEGVVERGRVSLYGSEFAGRTTASGERFDPEGLTMAHRTLPFGTRVRVTNLANHRSVEVSVNDRGPAVAGRIADLSLGAARQLGMVARGVIDAVLEVIEPGGARRPAVD